jgi:hypothetical protein
MQFLSEFPQDVINSHALVVAEIMTGEQPSSETLLQLAAEALAVDKMTTLAARGLGTLQATRECWQAALGCFQACADLWSQLPEDHNGPLAGHRRLLQRLICNALDRCEFYHVTEEDRAVFNAGRDHGLPLSSPYAEA